MSAPECAVEPPSLDDPRIRSVPFALVTHDGHWRTRIRCGVLDAGGHAVPEAEHWNFVQITLPPSPPDTFDHKAGRWLWGGLLKSHFGHFLIESTGRLWALDHLPGDIEGIVFLSEHGFDSDEARLWKSYHADFLRLLGIDVPILLLLRPTRFEELLVPTQGLGMGPLASGSAAMRAFVAKRLLPPVGSEPPVAGSRLYVSRSRIGFDSGGILFEAELEGLLAAEGYRIFHPQDHSMEVQLATYRAASQIVAVDGSALHLLAMVARPSQTIAMILRRSGRGMGSLLEHLSGFAARPPLQLDAVVRDWVRSDRPRPSNYSLGELDFALLSARLHEAGLIAARGTWKNLPSPQVEARVHDIENTLGIAGLTFAPMNRARLKRIYRGLMPA